MQNLQITYHLTDTLGTSGTITVNSDTAIQTVLDWFGMDDPAAQRDFARFLLSLGTRRPMWDAELAGLLGLDVQVVSE